MSLEKDFEQEHVRKMQRLTGRLPAHWGNRKLPRSGKIAEILKGAAEIISRDIIREKNSVNIPIEQFKQGAFYKRNRKLQNQIYGALSEMSNTLDVTIKDAITEHWELANAKNDAMVRKMVKGVKVPKAMLVSMNQLNYDALAAFLNRVDNGLNLSKRIWNLAAVQNQQLMELYLSSGITIGRSADKIAQDIRFLLLEPDKIFTRIKNEKGELVISEAEKQYHPGRGTYKSAFKNAFRVARTETNMAYRMADFERRKQLPFVYGIKVVLSNNHPAHDICDPMAGAYPKGFQFLGWHPQCICHSITVKMTKKEMRHFIRTGQVDQRKRVRSIPTQAKRHIDANKERIKKWKNPPYWADNFTKNFDLKSSIAKTRPYVPVKEREFLPGNETELLPQPFIPAKTKKEAKEYALKEYGIIDEVPRMNLDAKNAINKRIGELKAKYPAESEGFKYYRREKSKNVYARAETSQMLFNTRYFNNNEFFEQQLKRDVSTGFHPKGCDTMRSVVDHEFAHVLSHKYISSTMDEIVAEIKGLPGAKKASSFIKKLVKIRDEHKDVTLKAYQSRNQKEIDKVVISKYAQKNLAEFASESFSMALNSKEPTDIAKKVLKLFEEELMK